MMKIEMPKCLESGKMLLKGCKNEYIAYRDAYKDEYCVMPEFDRIHHPAAAIVLEDVIWPASFKSRMHMETLSSVCSSAIGTVEFVAGMFAAGLGFGTNRMAKGLERSVMGVARGKQFDVRLVSEMEERFEKILAGYAPVYGLASIRYGLGISANESVAYVENDLGVFYDAETGNYMEGTWKDDSLVFGVKVIDGKAFYGEFDENGLRKGIALISDGSVMIGGEFDEDGNLNCSDGFFIDLSRDTLVVGEMRRGGLEGMCIVYNTDTGMISKEMYKNDRAVDGIFGLLAKQKCKVDTGSKAFLRGVNKVKKLVGKG